MTISKAIIYTVINICLILLGVYTAFKITWTQGPAAFLGIVAFILVLGCSGALAITLTKLILPTNPAFDQDNWETFKKNVGNTKARLVVITFCSVFLITLSSAVYLYIYSIKKYEHYQLTTYGQRQKVRIEDLRTKGRGYYYAFFDFQLNGKPYSNELDSKQFQIGDSATIIFSTENPDVVKWADDFDKTDE